MRRMITALSVFCSIGHVAASSQDFFSKAQVELVYEYAVRSCPAVERAHLDGVTRRTLESKQLMTLLEAVRDNEFVREQDWTLPSLQKQVIASLEEDAVIFAALDEQIQQDPKNDHGRLPQLSSHKMSLITQKALELAQNTRNFDLILEGTVTADYTFDAPLCNIYPDDSHIFSNGIKANALKTVLMRTWCLQKGKQNIMGLDDLFSDKPWVETSPFVHITPLPQTMDVPGLENSPYYFSDDLTPRGIVTVHNGYAFGGQRKEARYPNFGTALGPQDCSSFTAKYTGSAQTFSTADLLYLSEDVIGFPSQQLDASYQSQWLAARTKPEVRASIAQTRACLEPLGIILDPQSHDLQPGLVHNERAFTSKSLSGTGGHTGLVLGILGVGKDARVLTMSAARDLEGTGKEFIYGVEARPFFSTPERLITFFKTK